MNGGNQADEGKGKLGGFYAYKNKFSEKNVWVEVPKNGTWFPLVSCDLTGRVVIELTELSVTFLNITDPYNMEASPEPEFHPATTPTVVPQLEERPAENIYNATYDQAPGLEALSAAATSDYQYIRPFSLPTHSPGDINGSSHTSNNLNFILNPVGNDGSLGMRLSWGIGDYLNH